LTLPASARVSRSGERVLAIANFLSTPGEMRPTVATLLKAAPVDSDPNGV